MELNAAKELIKLARKAILSKKIEDNKFNEKAGVFVTLLTYPDKELRGCIGFIEPIYPIGEGVQRAAVSAAYSDPRFLPITKEEIANVVIEFSMLSKSEETTPEKVKSGDGVIIGLGHHNALFLPQVWEQLPDKNEFLDALCMKAGLAPRSWTGENIRISKFYVEAFEEENPNGKIKKVHAKNY